MKKYLVWISLAAFLTTGCAGRIQNVMRLNHDELKYSYGDNFTRKKVGTLEVRSFVVKNVLPSETNVTWASGLILPLVIFNYWENEYHCRLGYNQIEGDYKQFMRDSFIEEVNRNSAYVYVEHQGTYTVDITISKIDMSASITGWGGFILLPLMGESGNNAGYSGEPINVDIQAVVVLKKGETIVFAREFHGKDYEGSEDSIRPSHYTTSMIFGLSMAIKNLNANIVNAINQLQIVEENGSRQPQ